ncbi:hypothetical protein TVAG_420200 [Trichomonas vaginalis G3]|uniref:Uncharacterized protein n=1 Tax=Trichomonas vaginalis (strain ATCC PRA-98 / G3) TaxID=412133 RepID=A2ED43_TRIV3|nr:armadillo (ARM) repeat-containing protein family [Trichomonas vaginalis G3]EAY09398.1 hypothetical protein TVAG_420200 [Trichomonas vaginalis G3]KAI5536317.1 armadillo (ARM) repeat-containing protein family [Trichomonas vaginalis G3]|eukprot:XP_001321621.1 hypothetical protein [Trichomonas vaginalis G3]
MANIINVWDAIVQRKIDNAQYILITYADTLIQNPDPCSIYLFLLMTYKANQVIPAKIASELKNFPEDVISIARSFGGVLACAFLQQILKLTISDMEIITNRYPNHCGKLFMHVFFQQNSQDTTISTDYMSIIEAIPVVFDTKPKLEADTFIKLFFRNWDQDPGLIKMYSTFTRTFVSAIQSLPSVIHVKTAEILIPYLNTFTKVAFETKDPLILFETVDVVSKIVYTREIGPHITPVMTSKICLSLLKLLCVSNKNYVEIGLDRAASSILSGNPIFMTIVPFLVHILNDLKIHPKTSVVSALESALLYFTVNDITKAIDSIEKKMINLLNTSNTQYSQSASIYFLNRSSGNDLNRISSKVITANIIKIFTAIFSKSFLTDTTMSFVRLVHGYAALNIPIPPDLEDCLKSINISYNLADGMYSLIDVADTLKTNNNDLLTNLVGIIITHFMIYSTKKDPRGSAQLMILAIELSRRLGDFNFIEDFLSRIKNMPDIIEVLVSHLSASNVVSFSPDINPVCIGVSSIDALQVLNEESEKNAQLLTARYTSKTSHRFDIIEEEDKSDGIEEKVETLKSEEEDFENSNPSSQTAKLFSNLKEKIISQNLRQLLNTPTNSDQKIENDKNREFKILSEKTAKIERKKSKPTNSDSTLLAMYCLGLFGENRYETLPSAGNIMQAFRRVISTTVKKEAKVPLYFARGGKFDWKWSETSKDFQSFAESLGRKDKSTTRKFGDWRLDGTFFVVPADSEYKPKCEDTMNDVRVVWSEDGITISSKDFNKDKNTTVICVQPLKTGFVRVTTMNAKVTSLLANTNIVRAESAPSMICTTVVTLCLGNEFNTPFTLGIPNKENIIKMVPQYV